MGDRLGAPVRVRRVSAELRELRQQCGLKSEEVAQILGFSLTKLSRMENGHRGLNADDVAALLGLYRVPTPQREHLLSLVRNGQERNWCQARSDSPAASLQDLMRFEAQATAIYNWEPLFIPGLLQTEQYTEAIIRGASADTPESEISSIVEARMSRGSVLSGSAAPELHVLLDEMILRRPVGDDAVLQGQLRHLVCATRRTNVTVQVVPFRGGIHPGWEGQFILLEFPKQPWLLYEETGSHGMFLEEPELVVTARQSFRRLRSLALSPDDSVDLIARHADETTDTQGETLAERHLQ